MQKLGTEDDQSCLNYCYDLTEQIKKKARLFKGSTLKLSPRLPSPRLIPNYKQNFQELTTYNKNTKLERSQSVPPRPPTRRKSSDMPKPKKSASRSKSGGPAGKKGKARLSRQESSKIYEVPPDAVKNPDPAISAERINSTIGKEGASEEEYLQFSLKITEEIIKHLMHGNNDIKQVFEQHILANSDKLDPERMQKQIQELCTEMNISTDGKRLDIFPEELCYNASEECQCSHMDKEETQEPETNTKYVQPDNIQVCHQFISCVTNTATKPTNTEECRKMNKEVLTLEFTKSCLFSDSTNVCVVPVPSGDSDYDSFPCPPSDSDYCCSRSTSDNQTSNNVIVIPCCCQKPKQPIVNTINDNSTCPYKKSEPIRSCCGATESVQENKTKICSKPGVPETQMCCTANNQSKPDKMPNVLEITEETQVRVRGPNNEVLEYSLKPGTAYVPKPKSICKFLVDEPDPCVPPPPCLKPRCSKNEVSTPESSDCPAGLKPPCSQNKLTTPQTGGCGKGQQTTVATCTANPPANASKPCQTTNTAPKQVNRCVNANSCVEEKPSSVMCTIDYNQQSQSQTCPKKAPTVCKGSCNKNKDNEADLAQFYPDKEIQADLSDQEEEEKKPKKICSSCFPKKQKE